MTSYLYDKGYYPTVNFRVVNWPDGRKQLQQEWQSDRSGWEKKWANVPDYFPSVDEIVNGKTNGYY